MNTTLNIGCGERTFDEYPPGYTCINFDERVLPEVNEVGDVRNLPYGDRTFNYLLCSDIIEHFPIAETKNILLEWRRVLMVSGVMEFRLPNLYSICKKYLSGKVNAKMTSYHLFGGQQYRGNFHYVAFDRKWFNEIILPLGFEELEYDTPDEGNNMVLKYKRII